MFSAPVGSGSAEAEGDADPRGPRRGGDGPLAGRSSPSALLMSTLLMLWFRCQYAHPAPATTSTSDAARQRCGRPEPAGTTPLVSGHREERKSEFVRLEALVRFSFG